MIKRIVRTVTQPKIEEPSKENKILIPSGCTLINLAASGSYMGAFTPGTMINIIGGSFAGKTFLAKSTMAEMAKMSEFDNYDIVEDNIEYSYDIDPLMGKKYKQRVRAPRYDEDVPICSTLIEEVEFNLLELVKPNKPPFLYDIDSLDALTTLDEIEHAKKRAAAYEKSRKKETEEKQKNNSEEKETKTAGTYGMDRAKALTRILRMFFGKIHTSNSFGIVVSQIRDKVDAPGFKFIPGPKLQRAGGKALKHYCAHEIWLTKTEAIMKNGYVVGTWVKAVFEKNRTTGKKRTVEFPILLDYGIDDVTANVEWLISNEIWNKKAKSKESSGGIDTGSFAGVLPVASLIPHIETNSLQRHVARIVGQKWNEIEDKLKPDRKPKYE